MSTVVKKGRDSTLSTMFWQPTNAMDVAASERLSGWARNCPCLRKTSQKGKVMTKMSKRLNVPKLAYINPVMASVMDFMAACSCAEAV